VTRPSLASGSVGLWIDSDDLMSMEDGILLTDELSTSIFQQAEFVCGVGLSDAVTMYALRQ